MKIKVILITLALNFTINIIAQEQLNHPKKVYISPEGRIYLQKNLPVHLWLSTSEDKSSEKFLLKSETSAKYSNPMFFDTEGFNTVRSPSAVDPVTKKTIYPLQDIIFEVFADSKAPVSKIDYGGSYIYKKNSKNYVKAGVKISFKSYDALSGIENIHFSINSEPYKAYSEEITLTEPKEYIIKYYSVDNVGNVEKHKTITLIIDEANPQSKIEFQGDVYNDVLSGNAKITIISEDNTEIQGIYYKMDDKKEIKYTSPIKMSLYPQGDHIIKFYAIDKVKNKEPLKEFKFYIDKTPPTIVEEILGNSFISNGSEYSSGRTKFKITTFDNKAGVKEVKYSINGSKFQVYEKPFYLDNTSGSINIKTYAVDWVNNKSTDNSQSNSKVDIPYIDLSGPSLNYTFIGPMFISRDTIFISDKSRIKLIAKDAESGVHNIEYKIDKTDYIPYENPFSINSNGLHSVNFTGVDKVNNKNQSDFALILDNKGPEIFSRYSITALKEKLIENKPVKIYPEHVVVFLSCTDDFSGYHKMFYKINNNTEKLYAGLIRDFVKGKDYTIQVRSIDKLGNETKQEFTFSTSL